MNYCEINTCDLANGHGIRVSLFLSGCKFNCKGCFNQEAKSFCAGNEFSEEIEEAVLKAVSNEHIDGLSLLGGDPLWQEDLKRIRALCDKVHAMGKDVWIWSGFTLDEVLDNPDRLNVILSADVFVEGRFVEEKKDLSLAWRGSSNQRVIDMNKTKEKGEIVLYEES